MKKLILILFIIQLSGCTVAAIKGEEKMLLKGWGAKKAVFADGSSIEKQEPIQVPDKIGVFND